MSTGSEFVVVANRLPVDLERCPTARPRWQRSPGGLVTALEPILRSRKGAWIGWPGVARRRRRADRAGRHRHLYPVPLSAEEVDDYYEGFSNATLWPLYHDVIVKPEFHREWWDGLRRGQPALRRGGRRRSPPRARRSGCRTTSCSWCRRCCASCGPTCGSASSCTSRSRRSSCSCSCRGAPRSSRACSAPTWSASSCPAAPRTSSAWPAGSRASTSRATVGSGPSRGGTGRVRTVARGAFPISIDSGELDELARDRERPAPGRARSARSWATRASILLGVDRLDYTKGIDVRLARLRELLDEGVSSPTTPCWCRWRRPAGSGSRATSSCAARSSARSAGSTASTARSASPPCTTCTSPYPGRN